MKLMWFHLMPYTELPDDFREKNPSVWVDIHSSLFDPRRAHHMYNDFLDELEYAAECGYDAICCNEHHSNGYGLMPSPNLVASALARRTTDTAICVLGNSLALYNPPTRVAEEFAMIDVISGGRLIAGFPVGSPMDTCYAYGQNPSMLRERYLEAHDLVVKAWTAPDTFASDCRATRARSRSAVASRARCSRRPRTRSATRRSSRCWRARWMPSSTRATSSSAHPTRSPTRSRRWRRASISAT